MDADQQAGLAGLLALAHDLLWWGGLAGVVVLVRLSLVAERSQHRATTSVPGRGASGTAPGGTGAAPRVGAAPVAVLAASALPGPSHGDRLVLLAGLTAAASGVHAVMVLAHARAGLPEALFFAVVAAAQAWQSARLLVSPSRDLVRGMVALDAALLAVWAASRTVGVMGPAEAVGPWDAAVVVWQVACIVVGLGVLRQAEQALRPPRLVPACWGSGTQVALAVTVLTLVLLPGAGHG